MLGIVFGTVFLAELGDKTQLVTLLFAADMETNKWIVFTGASLALIATSALGVLGGAVISQYVSERALHISPRERKSGMGNRRSLTTKCIFAIDVLRS